MRSYSGYLLLEDLFDDIPEASQMLYNESQQLFNPTVQIVAEDCGTLLGKRISLDFSALGCRDLASDELLTKASITALLAAGQYYRSIRHSAYCTAEKGICRKCYEANRPEVSGTKVGDSVSIKSTVVTGFFVYSLTSDDMGGVIPLEDDEFDDIQVYLNDVYTEDYEMTLTSDGMYRVDIAGISDGDVLSIRTYRYTASPFMSYMSKGFSGSIMGASPLDSGDLPIRAGLLKERISEARLNLISEEVSQYSGNMPGGYFEYASSLKDPLERELYLLCLYGVFHDIGV